MVKKEFMLLLDKIDLQRTETPQTDGVWFVRRSAEDAIAVTAEKFTNLIRNKWRDTNTSFLMDFQR